MTLAASSVLHYWSAGYGAVPIVGGAPHHTRSSAAKWFDQQGILQSAIVNTPREEWATISGERRKVMRLEAAGTNLVDSLDLSAWTNANVTVTASQPDPAGGTSAYLCNATAVDASRRRTVAFTADATKAAAILLRQGSASSNDFGIYDNTALAWRHLVRATWTAGVPALSTQAGSGTLFPIIALGGGWYIAAIGAAGVIAANTNQFILYPGNTAGTGSVYAYYPQAWNAATPSSLLAASTSRSADSFYWSFTPVPQALMVYARFIERGTALDNAGAIWHIGGASPRLMIYLGGSFLYRIYHSNGVGDVVIAMASTPAVGDVVEMVGMLASTGAVRLLTSINEGTVADTGASATLALGSAWGNNELWLNSQGSASGPGHNDYAEIKVVKYADVVGTTAADIMAELRAFELTAQGEVVS